MRDLRAASPRGWGTELPRVGSCPQPPSSTTCRPEISCSENHSTRGLSEKNLTRFPAINSGWGDYGCLPKKQTALGSNLQPEPRGRAWGQAAGAAAPHPTAKP